MTPLFIGLYNIQIEIYEYIKTFAVKNNFQGWDNIVEVVNNVEKIKDRYYWDAKDTQGKAQVMVTCVSQDNYESLDWQDERNKHRPFKTIITTFFR